MNKIISVIICIIICKCINAQNMEQLNEFIDVLYENDKFMGSLSVLKEGNLIFNKSVGYSQIINNEKQPITETSKFRIGSVTKTFTAVMIFQLVDEGKINLDSKLANYFPKIKNANHIAIANLLNHSSGLFNIPRDENFNEHKPITKKEMLDLIQSHDVDFQPNEKNEYSNTNYILLGYIIENIENTSYNKAVQKRIINKLELQNTYYGDVINTENEECLSYFFNDDNSLYEAKQAHLSNPGGAGAMVSNSKDLVVFMDALFNNKLMSETSFKTMTTINGEYGSGILSAKKGGKIIFAHNGSIDAFKSMVVYIPEHKISIAITANALNYRLMPIVFNVMAAIEDKALDFPNFGSVVLTKVELQNYEGVYTCENLPFNLVFKSDGKILKGAPEGRDPKVLKATGKDVFNLDGLGVALHFNLNENTLIFKQAGEPEKKCSKQ